MVEPRPANSRAVDVNTFPTKQINDPHSGLREQERCVQSGDTLVCQDELTLLGAAHQDELFV